MMNEINSRPGAFELLQEGVLAALETYSNVHRGSGHNSQVTTHLFEKARGIVLAHLGLSGKKNIVIFCTPRRAAQLKLLLKNGECKLLTSKELGLSLGVVALVAEKDAFPPGVPFQVGGGTTRLISKNWELWAGAPDRYEAGTPAIINIIAFAKALLLLKHYGIKDFHEAKIHMDSTREFPGHNELDDCSGKLLLEKLQQTHIGRKIIVPTLEGNRPFVNLDNAASTPTFTPVWDAFCNALRQPDELHQEIIRKNRLTCSEFLDAPLREYDIIFTSNTTEAINLVAESLGREITTGENPVILNTLLEHNSNELPWRLLPGYSQIRMDVDDEGFIDTGMLESLLKEHNDDSKPGGRRIKLVAVSGASNVLGTFNDLGEISRIVHRYGAQLIVDGAQLVAHHKVEMDKWGIDYLAFSGHKAYAPFGSGGLIARKGLLNFDEEDMELIRSSGEENVAGIAAMGKAISLLHRIGMDIIREEEQVLTRMALDKMSRIPGLTIYGVKSPGSKGFDRKGGVIVFSLKNIMGNALANKLASRGGIGTRYGCHCAHLIVKHILNVSPGLERFQHFMLTILPMVQLPGVARVSLGLENTAEDVDKFIQVLEMIAARQKINTTGDPGTKKASFKSKMHDFVKVTEEKVYLNEVNL